MIATSSITPALRAAGVGGFESQGVRGAQPRWAARREFFLAREHHAPVRR